MIVAIALAEADAYGCSTCVGFTPSGASFTGEKQQSPG